MSSFTFLDNFTIGHISGAIAAAIVVLQFLVPNALIFVLVQALSKNHSAVTWSVVSGQLQNSQWPLLLRSDTVASAHVPRRVAIITWIKPVTLFIIAVAAIVTPLGLHESIELSSESQPVAFSYLPDTGPLGLGTAARSSLGFSRGCTYNCPGSSGPYNLSQLGTSGFPERRIPLSLGSNFQSGVGQMPASVASFFDIQYRQYRLDSRYNVNNDTYLNADFRSLAVKILDNAVVPIEGLLVDYQNGGIGFRNHTAPLGIQYAAEWEEDIVFWQPETSCVNTNISMRYQERNVEDSSSFGDTAKRYIVDRGGFVDMNRTNPSYEWGYGDNPQKDARLQDRAYRAGWVNNALTMYMMNISEPGTNRSRITSQLGDTYEVDSSSVATTTYNQAFAISSFDSIAGVKSGFQDMNGSLEITNYTIIEYNSTALNSSTVVLWPNPYNISSLNYSSSISPASTCRFYLGGDTMNMTNIEISCGLLFGSGRPIDGPREMSPAPGIKWERPIYSCASATRVSIKTVRFAHNSTEPGLQSLQILSIKDKVYNSSTLPVWGMESGVFNISEMNPLYGIVDPDVASRAVNMTTLRADHFYVPASRNSLASSYVDPFSGDFMPAANGPGSAWQATYDTLQDPYHVGYQGADYSGDLDIDISKEWVKLTENVTAVPHMLNLIWTDIAANGFVGTRSWLTRGRLPPNLVDNGISALNTTRQKQHRRRQLQSVDPANTEDVSRDDLLAMVAIYPYVHRVRYHWVYAIPALICLALTALICLCALLAMCFGGTVERVRFYTMYLSTGRVMASFLYPAWRSDDRTNVIESSTKDWVEAVGARNVVICDRHDVPGGERYVFAGEKGEEGAVMVSDEVGNAPLYGEQLPHADRGSKGLAQQYRPVSQSDGT